MVTLLAQLPVQRHPRRGRHEWPGREHRMQWQRRIGAQLAVEQAFSRIRELPVWVVMRVALPVVPRVNARHLPLMVVVLVIVMVERRLQRSRIGGWGLPSMAQAVCMGC